MGVSKQQLLNEIMGVPRAIERWVDFFVQTNLYLTQEAVENENTDWEEHGATVGQTNERITVLKTQLGIGNSLPIIKKYFGVSSTEELLENEDFKSLPLWKPEIMCKITILPDETFKEFEKSAQYEASFGIDANNTKLTPIGSHKVLSKTVFILDVVMSASDADNGKFDKVIKLSKPTMAHELTHAYQRFKMYEKGLEQDFGKEGVLNSVINLQRMGTQTKEWSDLTYLIYIHLSFEINARVTQLYYELKNRGYTTKQEVIKGIKESPLWDMMVNLKKFDAKKFIDDHKEVDPFFMLMFGMEQAVFNKAVRGDDKIDIPNIRDKKDLLKYYIKMWDKDIQKYVEKTREMDRATPIMDAVPKKALEDPMVFLKFWENRFHKKGEEYRRKLLRAGQLLLNDINKDKVTKK